MIRQVRHDNGRSCLALVASLAVSPTPQLADGTDKAAGIADYLSLESAACFLDDAPDLPSPGVLTRLVNRCSDNFVRNSRAVTSYLGSTVSRGLGLLALAAAGNAAALPVTTETATTEVTEFFSVEDALCRNADYTDNTIGGSGLDCEPGIQSIHNLIQSLCGVCNATSCPLPDMGQLISETSADGLFKTCFDCTTADASGIDVLFKPLNSRYCTTLNLAELSARLSTDNGFTALHVLLFGFGISAFASILAFLTSRDPVIAQAEEPSPESEAALRLLVIKPSELTPPAL